MLMVLRALARYMRNLFKFKDEGDLLKSLSAFLRALIASWHSSVNHGFLILVEFVEVLGMHLFAIVIKSSVNF